MSKTKETPVTEGTAAAAAETAELTGTDALAEFRKNHTAYKFKETPKPVRVIFIILKYLVLVSACLLVILPLFVVLLGAFKTHDEYITTSVFALPSEPQWGNFATAFIDGDVLRGLLNTFIILLISCAGTIITGTMTAFVLQRFNSLFTRAVKTVFLVAALLPNISMQVTVFQVINSLGLYNTIWAPCILYIGTDIISIYIFMQFLNNISTSLDESAFLDGANYFRIYWSIILPMLRPAIATVLVIKFVGIYNDFYTANLYMPSKDLGVVSTALYRFIGPYGAKWEIIFAGIIICIIPSLIIFISLQKFIYSNLVTGSVKE
ncbi:MAG: carbohydrate ABC transporter permease [Ruminiclostridium sp.]|nr:carbohydrate ABC transporter permease [Ruminiclostridium sp.]